MACTAEQGVADSCIGSDAGCADCPEFANGMEGFMKGVDGAFKKTQAFVMTTDPAFCKVAQDNVDQEMVAKYSCCCSTELNGYVQCAFDKEWAPSFGLVGCAYAATSDEGGGDGEGGFPMMVVIIAVVVFVLLCCCCCCGCYFYRRRRRNNDEKNREEKEDEKASSATVS
jgi:hypothetical protein